MTDEQRIFTDEYLKDLNEKWAYKAVHVNVKKGLVAANIIGLLRNANDNACIDG